MQADSNKTKPAPKTDQSSVNNKDVQADSSKTKPAPKTDQSSANNENADKDKGAQANDSEKESEPGQPNADDQNTDHEEPSSTQNGAGANIAIVAAYTMKKRKMTGRFLLNMGKYTPTQIAAYNSEDIGDLRRYKKNKNYFKEVNLKDGLVEKRAVNFKIDGYRNDEEFKAFINTVSVSITKRHGTEAVSTPSLHITPSTYTELGNAFTLSYPWMSEEDYDSDEWVRYDYKVKWSFRGGIEVTQTYEDVTDNSITLVPPYKPETITINVDPAVAKSKHIRALRVQVFYPVDGKKMLKETHLKVHAGEYDGKVQILIPVNAGTAYEYQMFWTLPNNKEVGMEKPLPHKSSSLQGDNVPEH